MIPLPFAAAPFLPPQAPIAQLADQLGPNGLPYALPIHPTLVHFSIGLFVIAIAFDIAGALYPLEKRLFRFMALPATRAGLHDVGWYNLLACAVVSFFTVAAGFYEMLLAVPLPGVTSSLGLQSMATMLWHGVGGVAILLVIVAMTVWRGYQRFAWRQAMGRQVQWAYLLVGLLLYGVLGLHGTLGAELGAEFGVHVTADQLLAAGADLREALP
ncbi:MAG: membrane protein [Cyanobium sp. CACIAM 14]|nr:MAG: membrane protein [Cyanobium sp. CACIAM 14]